MQVFGLPGHVIRNDALERWRLLMGRGLSAAVAAKGVGIARATLYRWQKRIEPKSRRPHRVRRPTWTGALVQTVERLRADHPMWGKRKITVLLRRQGIAGLSGILCAGPVDHHARTNLSSNMMANWVFASPHSRGDIFHSAAV
jgi:hypothetical protein